MNKILENILSRYSCRVFLDKEIPKEDLELIVKAALYAPTAKNTQQWTFTVINNRSLIQELSYAVGKALDRDNYNMYNPQVLIIPSTKRDLEYGIDDNACALENIFLAANSLGIGSVWINQLRLVVDNPKVRKILNSFNIPEEDIIYGIAALGYPKSDSHKEIQRVGKVNYIN